MIQSHERNINHLDRLDDFWDGFVQSKWLIGVFQSTESKFKKFLSIVAYEKPESLIPGRWLQAGFIKPPFKIPACRKPEFGQSR